MNITSNLQVVTYKIDDLFDQLGVDYPPKGVIPTHTGTFLPAQAANSAGLAVGRNCTLTRLAGAMRRMHCDFEAIQAGLLKHNKAKFDPPLPEFEVSRIAKSIDGYPAGGQLHTLDDIGNVWRLLDLCGGDIRYIPEHGKWIYWDGSRWVLDSFGEKIMEFAKAVPAAIDMEASLVPAMPGVGDEEALQRGLRKHARASSMLNKLKAMIDLAGKDPDVSVPVAKLDSNKMLLGVANGVVGLRTGKLRENRKEDYITRFSPVVYDPKATCPEWHKFLNKISGFSGLQRWQRTERRRIKAFKAYLQRVVGYALTGMTSEQVLFFLHGHGANGKTVFMNTLEYLMGPHLAAETPSETLMASKQQSKSTNDLARLDKIRVVLSNEVEDGVVAEAMIKQMTGGDTISARYLYKEFFEFKPEFKLFISGNHKPVIRNQDHGIWRRIQLVPFTVTIPKDEQDGRLPEKLRQEASGILNWALKGCLAWQKQGLNPPEIITQAVQEYRAEMDLIGQWLDEECELGTGFTCRASEAYGNGDMYGHGYRSWCTNNGVKAVSSKSFGRKLLERGFTRGRDSRGVIYEGFKLRNGLVMMGGANHV